MQTLANSQFITQMSDCQIHQVRHWLTYRHRSPKSCRWVWIKDSQAENYTRIITYASFWLNKKNLTKRNKQTKNKQKARSIWMGHWIKLLLWRQKYFSSLASMMWHLTHLSLPYLSTTSAIWSVIVGGLHLVYVRRFNRWMKHWWECAAGRAVQMACSVCYKDLTETLWRHQHIPFSSTIKMCSLFKFY